jgi:single-strand DNA-binding protein
MNYIHIIGRLGKDAEERVTADGQKILTLVVATDTRKAGVDETIWYRVTFWGDRYAKMVPYFKKGKPVMVGGEMSKPTTYQDRNGNTQLSSIDVRADYVKFLPYGKPDEGNSPTATPGIMQGAVKAAEESKGSNYADPFNEDDGLPF